MVKGQTLLFRVDASAKIGTGHLMRCLALAQGWQKIGGNAVFAIATDIGRMRSRLETEGISIQQLSVILGSLEDGRETIAFAKQLKATWVIVDGYHFDADYQKQIKDAGLKLLFIDDYGHATHYFADLVLNQNIYANESLYPQRESSTKLLLGTRYVLLRQEFLKWQNWQREMPEVARKILVTLGGSDPDNVTLKAIQALERVNVRDLEVVAIVGGSNPHYDQLQQIVEKSQLSLSLKQNVTNMPELMAWADLAIAAGGSTNWELAFMGLPSLIIVLAENQRAIAEKLNYLNAAINLGWYKEITLEKLERAITYFLDRASNRRKIHLAAKKLVKGSGVFEVLDAMSYFN